eukprot:CAMPEP_0206468152 /NCGR_PEP_ID=MMETSP0324_2-20121206/29448_1 /ASSEMBLY_ACC=CAM_ASM_000836 /TAXON_ID=2866 /ORGANISM="Crypthecodinium cohnii, Strain Seligo" /LENGTH=59 /DNA_ID=CAMNT_0053941533 /DNA_START=255 /DNA_END=430 /DNA_ORIENTATION=-
MQCVNGKKYVAPCTSVRRQTHKYMGGHVDVDFVRIYANVAGGLHSSGSSPSDRTRRELR